MFKFQKFGILFIIFVSALILGYNQMFVTFTDIQKVVNFLQLSSPVTELPTTINASEVPVTTIEQTTITPSKCLVTTANPNNTDPLAYFKYEIGCVPTLEDISAMDPPPRKGKNIFFHETSFRSKEVGKLAFTARQACSIESAALRNPSFDVYVLSVAPTVIKNEGTRDDLIIQSLFNYPNLHIKHMNLERYLKNTPVEELYYSGKIESSAYAVEHVSDVLRYVSLWKFGGIYLDTDVFVLKSLENLPPNFTGLELPNALAAGIMGFDYQGKGHEWADICLQELNSDFRPKEWSYNSIGVLIRLLKKICKTSKPSHMNELLCNGFKVYKTTEFYPLSYYDLDMFFQKNLTTKGMEKLSDAYTLHLWNKLTSKRNVTFDGNSSVIELVAQKCCPNVYKASQGYF